MTQHPAMRPFLLLAAALAFPAAAQDWPATSDRKPLSSRAQKITATGYYTQGDDLEFMARELAACQPVPATRTIVPPSFSASPAPMKHPTAR